MSLGSPPAIGVHLIPEDKYTNKDTTVQTSKGAVEVDRVLSGADAVHSLASDLVRFFGTTPRYGSSACLIVGKRKTDPALLRLLRSLAEEAASTRSAFSAQIMATAEDGSVAYDCLSSSDLLEQFDALGDLVNITHVNCSLDSRIIYILVVSHLSPPCVGFLQSRHQQRYVVVQSCSEANDFIETTEDARRIGDTVGAGLETPVSTTPPTSAESATEELLQMCEGWARSNPESDRAKQLIAFISSNKPSQPSGPTDREKKLLERIKKMRQEQLQLVGEFQTKERQWQGEMRDDSTSRRTSHDGTW